jgi:thiamine pyrophosphate-dependent acetolactate synthase large subunit-like protein
VHGDARATIEKVNEILASRADRRVGYRDSSTIEALARQPEPAAKASDGIDPRALAARIGASIPDDAVVTVGCGHFWAFFHMYTPVRPDLPLYMSYQFGAIGQTLPIALGVCVAHPGRPHLVIEGDGSVMMNIQELETFARHQQPAVVLIWNDTGFGAEIHKLKARKAAEQLGRWEKSPDFVTVARGFGGDGVRVDREEDIAAALKRGFDSKGLFVIDARVSPSVISDPYLKLQFGVENRAPLLRGPGGSP